MKEETKLATIHITYQQFEDCLVTALEGGSNYWYQLDNKDIPRNLEGEREPASIRIARTLWKDPAYFLPVYDRETGYDDEDPDLLGNLTIGSFLANAPKAQWAFSELMDDTLDGDSADALFQMAVMGEIVFG